MTFAGVHPHGATVVDTFSGTPIDLVSPSADQINLDDIAHHLSQLCRFGGACRNFYSVAEHSVLVHDLVRPIVVAEELPPQLPIAALFHDGTETYLQDLIRPVKHFISFATDDTYGWLEAQFNRAIASRLGFAAELFDHPRLKDADDWAVMFEGSRLMNGPAWDAARAEGRQVPEGVQWFGDLDPIGARELFQSRAREVL